MLTQISREFRVAVTFGTADEEAVLAFERRQDPTTSDDPSQWNSPTGRWVRQPTQYVAP